jgi:uncharacterized lipoprotein YddW (UPF0748 family)
MARRVAALRLIAPVVLFLGLCLAHAQEARDTPEGAIRGVWVHPGTFGSEQADAIPKIQAALDSYVTAGVNTVMILVKSTSGHIYYEGDIGVRDPAYTWDFFAVFLDEATKRKITVHPWFCVFTEGAILGRVGEHPEWLIRGRKSEFVPAVNPALPEVRQYEIALVKELVEKYPVEWIHLDYVRYPCEPTEDYFSFDAQTRTSFKEYSGEDIATVRSMDSGNILWNEWIDWNGEQLTRFLQELRQALSESDRHVKISAAVFPDAGNARALIGQDWERWAKEGLLDMLCPMLYTNNHMFYEKYVRNAVAITRGRCLLGIGIGIGTSHNQNTPDEVVRQIRSAHNLGADGTLLFSSGSLTEDFLKAISQEGSRGGD